MNRIKPSLYARIQPKSSLIAVFSFLMVLTFGLQRTSACHAISLVNVSSSLTATDVVLNVSSDQPTCCNNTTPHWADFEIVPIGNPFSGVPTHNSGTMVKPSCIVQPYPATLIPLASLPGQQYIWQARERIGGDVGPWVFGGVLFPAPPPPPPPPCTGFEAFDNFDPGVDLTKWSNISLGNANTTCGSVSGNALYFNGPFGTQNRFAETIDLDFLNGGEVQFSLIIATGGQPCENADPGEDVQLQYSLDGGLNWVVIQTYNTEAYPSFTAITEIIPPGAYSSSTRLRWVQVSHSGSGFDNWAIDDIGICVFNSVTIPTVSEWGLIAFGLMFLVGASILLYKKEEKEFSKA